MSDLEATFWWVVVPFCVVSPLVLLVVLGICLAPFAAVTNAIIAKLQGRGILINFTGGLVSSMILFLPWTCLLSNHLGWPHTRALLQVTQCLAFLGWGLSLVVLLITELIFIIAFGVGLMTEGGVFAGAFAPYSPLLIVATGALAVSAWLWATLRKRIFDAIALEEIDWSPHSAFVPLEFMAAPIFALVWALVTPAIIVGAAYAILQFTFGSL